MGWLYMHLYIFDMSSPPGSGFHRHLAVAESQMHHVSIVITYHYAALRFQ